MEEQILGATKLVNWILGKPEGALFALLGIRPANPEYRIPNHIAMEIVVFAFAAVFFLWLKARLSVERPGAAQQCMEMLITNPMSLGVRDLLRNMVGHGSDKYMPMLGSIGIFVLFCNLISLVPGLPSPTATNSVPLGCAIVVFLYYNYCGIRKQGLLNYGKHFLGPAPAMMKESVLLTVIGFVVAPLIVVIEMVSNLARLLSLTVRLWVNMVVSELLYVTFLGLTLTLFLYVKGLSVIGYALAVVPLLVPILFIALHAFVALVQAFVFTILPTIYLAGAVAHEEH
ncbi:MAG TPA: FoF1 ATP synthase subunit a [Terriglobales bacterium]|nr:FoF1 ATP synthase subunit a [Terriglobales bacterium]